MITLSEGSKERLPFVQVEITTGRYWFEYWFEVSYWVEDEECWYHDYTKDSGAFGLWFVLKKAYKALHDMWFELYDNK